MLSIPLVGTNFHPPAKEVLSLLPTGTKFTLIPEPENSYDSNAVIVAYDMTTFPEDQEGLLDSILPGEYFTTYLREQGMLHMGYLAASGKKTAKGGPGNIEALLQMSLHQNIHATLGNAPEGYPTVEISWEN